jgi:hypothetical protein
MFQDVCLEENSTKTTVTVGHSGTVPSGSFCGFSLTTPTTFLVVSAQVPIQTFVDVEIDTFVGDALSLKASKGGSQEPRHSRFMTRRSQPST